MAYNLKKILIYGAAGIIIAVALITWFLPVQEQVTVNSYVSLQEIPGYGIQYIKLSEEQADLKHLILSIEKIEVQLPDGRWLPVTRKTISYDILHDMEKTITLDTTEMNPGDYSVMRFNIIQGLEYTNASLSNDEILTVDAPDVIMFETQGFTVDHETESLNLVIQLGSGRLSNHILPQYHISVGTMKLQGVITNP